jgi:hypothetical protein
MSPASAVQPVPVSHPRLLALTRERLALLAFTAAALVLRAVCIVRYRIDSDEPQHLHNSWLWSQGLVGYRDFYDNHTPLFHLLTAPLIAAFGETPHILLLGRLLMLPLAAAVCLLTYRIASRIAGPAVAGWATLFAAIAPPLLLKSVEFRNDNLWVVWSLAAVALVLGGPLTPRRAAALGAVIALSLLTSIKTVFFAGALAVAVLGTTAVTVPMALAATAGFAVPLAAAAAWFAARGALRALFWCAIEVNGKLPVSAARRGAGAVLVALLAVGIVRELRRRPTPLRMLSAVAILFTALVLAFSPLVSARDLLPAFPIVAILAAAALIHRESARRTVVVALIAASFAEGRLWQMPDPYPERLIAEALAVSQPSDPVLDLKGETIFRRRPSYMALEVVGRNALARGIVAEQFDRDVVARRCYVVTRDADFFPPRTRRFLNEHFLGIGDLRVAGSYVNRDRTASIAVPGWYATVGPDGAALDRGRWYDAGSYRCNGRTQALVWAPAVARGYIPTALRGAGGRRGA